MTKKRTSFYRCLVASVFSLIFLFGLEVYAQPIVDWSLSYPKAEKVDVGSSKHAEIELKFEMADEPVTGGIIRVTIPNAPNDFYEASKPAYNAGGAGAIVLGTPTYSGGVLEFPAANFPVGKTLHYIIPHRAVDNLPVGITSGQVKVEILDNTNTPIANGGTKTVNFNYRRANLTIVNPGAPTPDQTGLTVNFGTNNGSHDPLGFSDKKYRFAVKTSNGSIDSLRVKFKLPTVAATITPGSWEGNDIAISRVTSVSTFESGVYYTTYTLYLTKDHSLGADGFDDGEQVDISVMAKKTYCGNTTITMSTAWGSSGDYVASSSVPGSFSANSSTGSPVMNRVSMAPLTTNPWNADAVTPNEFITKAKNVGTAEACDIVYNVWVFAWNRAPTFMDLNGQYSVDGGSTWKNITAESAGNRTTVDAQYRNNPAYVGKPYSIRFRIPDKLPAGQEIHIKWKFYIAPDMYISDASNRADRDWLRLIRWDDSWSYTDLCRSATSNLQSQGIYSTAEYMKGTNQGPSINLNIGNPDKEYKLHFVQFLALGDSKLTKAGRAVGVNLKLPKGVKIKNLGPKYGIRFADANGSTVGEWNYTGTPTISSDPNYNYYSFKFTTATNSNRYLYVHFERDCLDPGATSGLHDMEITYDLYPTGTVSGGGNGTGADVIMKETMKYYNQVSLSCSTGGISYTWDIRRQTVGLMDSDNDNIPDASNAIITPAYLHYNDIDHKQMVCGDTTHLIFDGTVGGSSDEYIYAVVFSEVNQTIYQILKDKVTVTGTNNYQAEFINSYNGNNPYSITAQLPPKKFAYVWKITKTPAGSLFTSGENVILTVPFKSVSASGAYTPSKYRLGSWMYSSTADLGTAVNFASGAPNNPGNPGLNRHGDEEYGFSTMYFRGYHGGWTSKPTLNFTGVQTVDGSFYVNPVYGDYVGWTPYEFRTLATHDTIYVNVPDGYRIGNAMKFRIEDDNGSNLIINAHAANSTKTKKAFAIKDVYITSAGNKYITTPGANEARIREGSYRIQAYPDIISTPRTPVGTSTMSMTSVVDMRTHTHAFINNTRSYGYGSSSLVFAEGPGVKLTTTDAASKNLGTERMSWNLTLNNTFGSSINQMWLYVEGPVKNVKFGTIDGVGEDGRWIKLDNVATTGITADMSFDVIADNGCTNKTIKVYPIFNNANPATFAPFGGSTTDAAFNASRDQDGGDFDTYVYRELLLTINTVDSKIEGSITDWFNTPSDPEVPTSTPYGEFGVDKGMPFTVEVVFDASGSSGPVSKPSVSMDFPKGLEYHVDSAYIEYKNTVIRVSDPSWISNLNTLTGDANPHNNVVFNLEDLYTTQDVALKSLLGDYATIEAGEKLYFRFKLRPTCDIALTGERIGARFSGKRFCDFAANATNNGQTVTSDQLTLLNPMIGYRSGLSITMTPDLDTMMCEPGKDQALMTVRFHKRNKSAEVMAVTDSIRIGIPADLDFDGKVSFHYPAYNINSLNIPEENGEFATSEMSSYFSEDGSTRYLSWQVPYNYLNTLATQSVANDSVNAYFTYNFKVKLVNRWMGNETIESKFHTATIAQYGVHITCPNNILAEADSIDKKIVVAPSTNANLTHLYVNNKLVSGFDPNQYEYDIVLPCGTDTISIGGTPYSGCAWVKGVYKEPLERYFKRFEVLVIAQDGIHSNVYVVNARPLMPAQILEDLSPEMTACQSIDYTMSILADGDSLSYQWYYHNDLIPGATTNSLNFNDPQKNVDYGYYSVIVNGACESADTTISARFWVAEKLPEVMSVDSIPETVYTNMYYRAHVGFDYGHADVTKYTWSFTDTLGTTTILREGYPGQTIQTYIPGPHSGILRVDMEHPCASYFGPYYADKLLEVIDVTGINGAEKTGVQIYPNPIVNELHIVSEAALESVIITDISGRRVAVYMDVAGNELVVPASSWVHGTYMISIKTGEDTIVKKIIKK